MPRMSLHGKRGCAVGLGLVLTVSGVFPAFTPVPRALGECTLARSTEDASNLYSKHLSQSCTDHEREAHAVNASELLSALKEGKGLDLQGVVVKGDLDLDALPLSSGRELDELPPVARHAIERDQAGEIRVISGPITIRDSQVRGAISTNLKQGLLVLTGPVNMTGTTFERSLDLSHTLFLKPVDFSGAIFSKESLFVQAQFHQPVRFENTTFGFRTRFHKAHFRESVTFLRAGFNGMGEFLEVSFDKDASFSMTYFKLGVGFSGSRFRGMLDFSEALFEREAFFLYTIFEQDAYFRRTTFRGQADFSNAEFQGMDDFSKAFFDKEPRFVRTKVSGQRRSPGGLQDPTILYGIAAALFVFTLVFIFVLRRR